MAPASGRLAATLLRLPPGAPRRCPALTTPNVAGRRCVLTRSSAAGAVAKMPASDEHADVAVVGPAFVDLDRARRDRRSQPVSCDSTSSADVHDRSRSDLGDAARTNSSARHASPSDGVGPGLLWLARRKGDFGRRKHAADAAHARERGWSKVGDRPRYQNRVSTRHAFTPLRARRGPAASRFQSASRTAFFAMVAAMRLPPASSSATVQR